MSDTKTKNDVAWEALFAERNIVADIDANGIHRITADDINKKREARLMTKIDHRIQLPEVFSDNKISILPDSRGSYLLGRFDCYQSIPAQREEPEGRPFPDWMKSLLPSKLYSESAALLCAFHAKLLDEVVDDELAMTVFGRMSTGIFDFSIDSILKDTLPHHVQVNKAQCEIDGGFESVNQFVIVEAKNEEVDDFNIRQIYYPYRLWAGKLNKPVVPVFLSYSNEVFSFSVYEFTQPDNYNSLQLVKRQRFQIEPTEIDISDVRDRLAKAQKLPEPPRIPFPQADSFKRVIDLLLQLRAAEDGLSQEEITTHHAFDRRQTQYYSSAGKYLGLIEEKAIRDRGIVYFLTPLGNQLLNQAPRSRNLALIERMLSFRVFRGATEYYLENSAPPTVDVVVSLMQQANLSISGSTLGRRAQTVIGWVRWIIGLTAEG